jgi:hypothetical protein
MRPSVKNTPCSGEPSIADCPRQESANKQHFRDGHHSGRSRGGISLRWPLLRFLTRGVLAKSGDLQKPACTAARSRLHRGFDKCLTLGVLGCGASKKMRLRAAIWRRVEH